jgi:hypothetical protein
MRASWRSACALAAALALLNAALTFGNLWPTPWIVPRPLLSAELAALLLSAAGLAAWRGAPSTRSAAGLAALTLAWALGRYTEVTVPALFGRPLNLYWDAPHLPAVAAMLAEAAAPWRVALAAMAAAAILAAGYFLLRRAWREVLVALARPAPRRALGAGAAAVLAAYLLGAAGAIPGAERAFARPVVATVADQAAFLAEAGSGEALAAALAPAPVAATDLARLRGADVYLVFVESYGAVAFDHPGYDAALAGPRAALAGAIAASGHGVVSARVTAPTFGGRSWLSHASLLAGVEVREPRAHDLLLTTERPTLVTQFRRQGYRTLALMPGLRSPWPEGRFWGFDAVLGSRELDYRGPEFGWWRIPDQYALALLHADEASRADRAPLFVFFPTITSHAPFRPTPPYQPDWRRLLSAEPFDAGPLAAALAQEPQWHRLGPGYVDSLAYAHATLAGYLALPRPRDAVFIVIGDHQPPGSVAGPGQPWHVPVHVIARRGEVLAAFEAAGFVAGLKPPQRPWGPMHALKALLLAAFGESAPLRSAQAPGVDVAGSGRGGHAGEDLADARRVGPVRHRQAVGLAH